jgi:hypothetical protein
MLRPLDRRRYRTIHLQRPVRAPMMVIPEVTSQEPPEMLLVQDDHVVQAFTADTSDQPFDVRVLPRTPWGDDHFSDPHVPYSLPKRGTVDAIPIVQEIPRGLVPREGIDDLLCGLRRSGMLSDVEMYETLSLMGQDEQDEQHFVGDRRHDKEIQGHQILHVVLQESLPRG